MSLPGASKYSAFYCEENIWHLCRRAIEARMHAEAVIISNPLRQCLLWNQRNAPEPGYPVCWDYHVVMVERGPTPRVWDLDTVLGCPVAVTLWWEGTFPLIEELDAQFWPQFRVFSAAEYVRTLSTSRQHMRRGEEWLAPPPPWRPPGDGPDNLMRLVDMTDEGVSGEVLTHRQLLHRYEGNTQEREQGREIMRTPSPSA